jgi:hypothetical protein
MARYLNAKYSGLLTKLSEPKNRYIDIFKSALMNSKMLFVVVLLILSIWGSHGADEEIEWCNIWITQADNGSAPRILLIGDSITSGYASVVERCLPNTSVCRLTTSGSLGSPELLDEITLVLNQYKFDLIHLGQLHGGGYTDEEYKANFLKLIESIQQNEPNAKLIWGTTTPRRTKGNVQTIDNVWTEQVKERNRIANEIVTKKGILRDDLFSVVVDHPEYSLEDGLHFNEKGCEILGEQVANVIRNTF